MATSYALSGLWKRRRHQIISFIKQPESNAFCPSGTSDPIVDNIMKLNCVETNEPDTFVFPTGSLIHGTSLYSFWTGLAIVRCLTLHIMLLEIARREPYVITKGPPG